MRKDISANDIFTAILDILMEMRRLWQSACPSREVYLHQLPGRLSKDVFLMAVAQSDGGQAE